MGKSRKNRKRAVTRKHTQPEERITAVRPTPERQRHGVWLDLTGPGKNDRAAVDLASDQIGWLYHTKQITSSQEQTARNVQDAWAAYSAELNLSTGRSCLDIGPVGYQGDDGNPHVIKAWRDLTRRLNSWQYGALIHTACQDNPPGNIRLLRDALNILGEPKKLKNIA